MLDGINTEKNAESTILLVGKVKRKLLTWLMMSFVFNACGNNIPQYVFHRGTELKKMVLPGEKTVQPSLVIPGIDQSFSFPLGAAVWHESQNKQYVFVKYPDQRFAAFYTEAIDVIDLKKGIRHTVVKNTVFHLKSNDSRTIVTVQRTPDRNPDAHYDESTLVLVATDISFFPFVSHDRIIDRGNDLPDLNRIFTSEDEQRMEQSLYMEGKNLFFRDLTGRIQRYYLSNQTNH